MASELPTLPGEDSVSDLLYVKTVIEGKQGTVDTGGTIYPGIYLRWRRLLSSARCALE